MLYMQTSAKDGGNSEQIFFETRVIVEDGLRLFSWGRKARPPQRHRSRPLVAELLEDRGLMAALVAALTDDSYEPNDSFGAAKNLGTLSGPATVSNLVMADSYDWFKFTTAKKPATSDNVTINFQHSQGDLDIRL